MPQMTLTDDDHLAVVGTQLSGVKQPDSTAVVSRNGLSQRLTRSCGFTSYRMTPGESYMSPAQIAHFKAILSAWKEELLAEARRASAHILEETTNPADVSDRASQEESLHLAQLTGDRGHTLIQGIEHALRRLATGEYGFCALTGEEIGLRRLEAFPLARLSVEAQEQRERLSRQFIRTRHVNNRRSEDGP